MKTSTPWIVGAVVLVLGTTGMAMAHGDKGGKRGGDRGASLEMLFEQFDSNKDGKVTAEEVQAARAAQFTAADADGDGLLSAEELMAFGEKMRSEQKERRHEARADRMIDRLDSDEDGKLSAEEMAEGGPRGDRFERMLKRLDADDDGAISLEEIEDARAEMRGHGHKGGKKRHGAPWWMPKN